MWQLFSRISRDSKSTLSLAWPWQDLYEQEHLRSGRRAEACQTCTASFVAGQLCSNTLRPGPAPAAEARVFDEASSTQGGGRWEEVTGFLICSDTEGEREIEHYLSQVKVDAFDTHLFGGLLSSAGGEMQRRKGGRGLPQRATCATDVQRMCNGALRFWQCKEAEKVKQEPGKAAASRV